MSVSTKTLAENIASIPNGSGAAAILSAGIGCFAVAFFALAADQSAAIKNLLNFYQPTGALSGETTLAILFWLASWAILNRLWCQRTVSLRRINLLALSLLALSLLLTFPPVADLL